MTLIGIIKCYKGSKLQITREARKVGKKYIGIYNIRPKHTNNKQYVHELQKNNVTGRRSLRTLAR